MQLRAGFAEVEITPALGTHKAGWLTDIVSEAVLDPLFARAAIFECGGSALAFVQLDTLSIRWTQVNEIRRRVQERYGFPGERVMVSATHNHAGPAIANCGDSPRDDVYLEELVSRAAGVFGEALGSVQDAEVGFGSAFEFRVAHNRRVLMRDGTTRTHGNFSDPMALCIEGPMDPEVAVLAARSPDGPLLGCLVNYACHPTEHGGDTLLSAGYPGVLAAAMKERGCPVTLFLNGACGDTHTSDPCGASVSMEEAGRLLAEDAARVIEGMSWRRDVRLDSRSRTLQLPYRELTEAEVTNTAFGAQPFRPEMYLRRMPGVVARVRERGRQPAEVQVHRLDEIAIAAIPAEYFCGHGLRIKREAHPAHALVVSCANGMVGYVPTREAFTHGGYETTLAGHSRLAPEAGDLLCAVELTGGRQIPS